MREMIEMDQVTSSDCFAAMMRIRSNLTHSEFRLLFELGERPLGDRYSVSKRLMIQDFSFGQPELRAAINGLQDLGLPVVEDGDLIVLMRIR